MSKNWEEMSPFDRVTNIVIGVLSFYVVVELALELILKFHHTQQVIIQRIDFAICVVFLFDWFRGLVLASRKWRYCWNNLLDLISSLPLVSILRVFRVARMMRFIRLLRMVRTLKFLVRFMRMESLSRMQSALVKYTVFMVVFYFYATVGIMNFESGLNANIRSYEDAMWLGFTSITTIGYGDIYPVTTGGRIMTALLSFVGIGMFSLITGQIALLFVSSERK